MLLFFLILCLLVFYQRVRFDCKRLKHEFEKRGVPHLSGGDSQSIEDAASVIQSLQAKVEALEAQVSANNAGAISSDAHAQQPSKIPQATSLSEKFEEHDGLKELQSTIQSTIASEVPKDTKTLHIVDYPIEGSCGEMQVPKKVAFLAKMLGGYKDGECSLEGYGVEEGTALGTKKQDSDKAYTIYGRN